MELTKNKKLSLYFGSALILNYLTIFKNFKDCLFEIEFTNELITTLRSEYSDEYYSFLKNFLIDSIKSFDNVVFLESSNYPLLLPLELLNSLGGVGGGKLQNFELPVEYISNTNYKNYVIMNTKVISGPDIEIYNKWNNEIKQNLFNILNKYDINVILVGEKTYNDCLEYKIHNTFSIYEDVVNGGITNLIDMTVTDTISLYSKENIKRNFNLLNKSLFNIHIGGGGGSQVYAHLNNLISFTTEKDAVVGLLEKFYNIHSFNSEHFLKLIDNTLSSYEYI